ncbi:dATP/dGTP diphosphohydrolase domain-containing protein [Microbulbifer sp. 2201CG32-9]|uniref:dATP/dGTP diphosphohydrolase domain-containing protein n=1 Tax=Microbulbifer sp. 2201CG32-9 TaxID=3232309 RepID=UPI00345B50DD
MSLPTDNTTRKGLLMFQGLFRYFPHALAAVGESSRIANEQHNPGTPVHWDKSKSTEELDSLLRHLADIAVEETHRDPDGIMAATKLAWRALANLQRLFDKGVDIFHVPPTPELAHADIQDFYRGLDRALPDEEPVMITETRNSIDDCTPDEWSQSSRQVLKAKL